MKDKHKNAFIEEAHELLAELEDSLLELEEKPGEQEIKGRVFRALHTIKGSGAMFGFEEIAGFTHEVETVFDLVRKDRIPATKELIDLTLAARDHIYALLDASTSGQFVDDEISARIISLLRGFVPEETQKAHEGHAAKPAAPAPAVPASGALTYRIRFRPGRDVFLKGTNLRYVLEDLKDLGVCLAIAQLGGIPDIEELDPEHCYVYWDIILTTSRNVDAIREVFMFLEDGGELKIEVIDEGGLALEDEDYKRVGEILVERGDINIGRLQDLLLEQRRIGEILVDRGIVQSRQVESALLEQQHVLDVRRKRQERDAASTIRVASEKLDKLVDLVGELVTVQARLTQVAALRADPELQSISEEVESLASELHDSSMSIRMVPIGTTFSKFRRIVRDLAKDLGRDVSLFTVGAETELDKTVIERLNDPMVHMIRNCLDHGIEPPSVREAAGKPPQGTLRLSAMHSGANVLIEVSDDGAGLDVESIRERAVEMGLIAPEAVVPEQELHAFIFHPGFTTARKVTGLSGRGVGMDVVKRSIEALRGSVAVRSRKGLGTTITLSIPLTLAIIEGLLVRIGDGYFVFPLYAVEECIELSREDVKAAYGKHIAKVRGEVVPYIRLREEFSIDGELPEIEQVVITNIEGRKVGFVADTVIGEHQTVIKGLGRFYRDVNCVSGATILGDGTVALIVDLNKLYEKVEVRDVSPGNGGQRSADAEE